MVCCERAEVSGSGEDVRLAIALASIMGESEGERASATTILKVDHSHHSIFRTTHCYPHS